MSGYKYPAEEAQLPPLPLATGTVPCKSCGYEMPRVLHAQAKTLVCSCKRIYSNGPKGLNHEGIFNEKKNLKPWIPLGSSGKLKEIKYQIVGYQLVKEKGRIYTWSEYILFNPLHGYAFLSEYDGHWNFFRYVGDLQHNHRFERTFDYQGHHFDLFNKYEGKAHFAVGEFPWDILEEQGKVWEYISPPYCMNKTISKGEISWMYGEYLEPEDIQKIFGIQSPPPTRVGIGANEPMSMSLTAGKSGFIVLVASILLLFMHIYFVYSCKEKLVFRQSFSVPATSILTEPISAPAFELTPDLFGTTNMELILHAPVDNSWFATGVSLIHQPSGKEYYFEMGVEYYSGYTDGTNWSEGSKKKEKILSALPPGSYQMLIYPYQDPVRNIGHFNLEAREDVVIWSNFWILVLALWLIPIIQYTREYYFERSRWMKSDYSPYDK